MDRISSRPSNRVYAVMSLAHGEAPEPLFAKARTRDDHFF